jgi:hypothetical protein
VNDLDRKIAELKGYVDIIESLDAICHCTNVPVLAGRPVGKVARGLRVDAHYQIGGPWSTSDSKALELVDELQGRMSFLLCCSPSGILWCARFSPVITGMDALNPPKSPVFDGDAPTRPEAICRAYIAAREWMAKKS